MNPKTAELNAENAAEYLLREFKKHKIDLSQTHIALLKNVLIAVEENSKK